MKNLIYFGCVLALCVLLCGVLTFCTHGKDDGVGPLSDCDTLQVSYKNFIQPLFYASCRGCHYDSSYQAHGSYVSVQTYAEVKAQADQGWLKTAFSRSAATELDMPPANEHQLSPCEVRKIMAWINAGAPNN